VFVAVTPLTCHVLPPTTGVSLLVSATPPLVRSCPLILPSPLPINITPLLLLLPRRLLELSGFAPDPDGSGSEAYRAYVTSEGRAVWEVLRDFGSVHIPLRHLLELLPPLQPRHYSIASAAGGYLLQHQQRLPPSAVARPAAVGRLDLCVGLVEYATPLRRRKVGVASGFLGSLRPGVDSVWLQIRRGTFTPPWPAPELRAVLGTAAAAGSAACDSISTGSSSSSSVREPAAAAAPDAALASDAAATLPLTAAPLILVGPGTGIAPMRALWQERQLLQLQQRGGLAAEGGTRATGSGSSQPDAAPLHACTLFFGCRNAAQDWLYGPEIVAGPLASGALVAYDAAFSRPAVAAAAATATVVGLAGAGLVLSSTVLAAAGTGSTLVTVASPPASGDDGTTEAAAGAADSGATGPTDASALAPSACSTHLLLLHTPPAGWVQAGGTMLADGAAAASAARAVRAAVSPLLSVPDVAPTRTTTDAAAVPAAAAVSAVPAAPAPPVPAAGAATAPPPVTYVQARIAAPGHGPAIARAILQQGAVVFISGSAKRMPSDVIAALRGLLQAHGGMSPEEAARYVGAMERGRRLVTEAWS